MINLNIFLISFRDFLEAFILISILLGFSKKQTLNKEKTIISGGVLGLAASITIAVLFFYIFPLIKLPLSIEIIDTFGHFAVIAAGLFILFVTFKMHPLFIEHKQKHIGLILSNQSLIKVPLFFIMFFLVLQEGIEIILFTSTVVFLNSFLSNTISLISGFLMSLLVSVVVLKTYLTSHIKKLFLITELLLVIYAFFIICYGLFELYGQVLSF